ncbi:MAG: MFS transporter [Bacteroidales bacterium]
MVQEKRAYSKDKNLKVIFALTLVAVMGVSTITPVLPDIRADLHLSNQQVGLLVVFFSLPGIIMTPLLGILADRFGRKTVLVPSLVMFALAGFTCFFLRDFHWILFFRVLQGAGAASLGSLNSTLIGDIYSKKERPAVMGLVASVLSIGTAAYPAIGGALAIFGWHYPFLMPLLALPVAWAVLFKLENPEPKGEGKFMAYIKEAAKQMKSFTVVFMFLANFVVFVTLFGAFLTYLPLFMNDNFNSSSLEIGMTLTGMSLVTAVTSAMLGKISKHFSERQLIIAGFMAYVIAFSIVPFLTTPLMLAIPITIFGIGHGINFPSIQVYLVKVASLKYRGMFMSFNGMVLRLGQTAGPLIIGGFYLIGGHLAAFSGAALLSLLVVIFLSFFLKM